MEGRSSTSAESSTLPPDIRATLLEHLAKIFVQEYETLQRLTETTVVEGSRSNRTEESKSSSPEGDRSSAMLRP